ncbi:hypothetical protein RQP46_006940 [Phenoliferia psychrophenolica]
MSAPASHKPKKDKDKAAKVNYSSLSSVVSNLVRSSYGASASQLDVPDDQLDRHVADLLLAEASEKQKQWGTRGTRAYLDELDEPPKRKPNKRFLTNMIKSVDDHNSALKKAEADAARKRERNERDAANEWRTTQRAVKSSGDPTPDAEIPPPEASTSKRSRDRSPSPVAATEPPRQTKKPRSLDVPLPPAPPPPPPPGPPPSKMDKYFAESYDPRLDVNLADLTLPSGLIAAGAFDNWDTMLRVVKERKDEKREREQREKDARKAERDRVRKEREDRRSRKGKSKGSSGEDEPGPKIRWTSPEIVYTGPRALMDMSGWAKKGATREWDNGKEELF